MQSRGQGKTYREETYLSTDLSWAAPPYTYACGCVLAYADKRLTKLNIYTHSTDQPITHLRGQPPTKASEPPAKVGADSRVDDVVCREEEGGATAACRRRRGNQGKNGTAKIIFNHFALYKVVKVLSSCFFLVPVFDRGRYGIYS